LGVNAAGTVEVTQIWIVVSVVKGRGYFSGSDLITAQSVRPSVCTHIWVSHSVSIYYSTSLAIPKKTECESNYHEILYSKCQRVSGCARYNCISILKHLIIFWSQKFIFKKFRNAVSAYQRTLCPPRLGDNPVGGPK
jgi:hypothetical protein